VFKKILMWVLKAGLAVLGIAAVLAGLALLVNSRLFDEAPHPEIAAFVQFEAPKLPDEQNAYFHLIGLGAPEAEQPHAAGKKWLASVNDAQARRMKGEFVKWPEALGTPAKLPPDLCRPAARSCLTQARDNPDEMRKLVAANERLIARYRATHAYPAYAEPADGLLWDYFYVTPGFSVVLSAQRLFLMDAALRLQQGELKAVLADLGKEIALCRRMLAGSRSLLDKHIANRCLARSALFASEVLGRHREQAGAAGLELQELLQPLTPSERQVGDAIRHDFRGTKLGLEHLMQYPSQPLATDFWTDKGVWTGSWFGRALIQPNATFNHIYHLHKAKHAADMAPVGQLDAALLKAASEVPEPSVWTMFYNPVGKQLVHLFTDAEVIPDFSEHIKRMHDLDALVRLVALQAEIVAKGVKDEDMLQFLAATDKRYANPWTGKPMQWDPKARQIYFEPRSKLYQNDKIGGAAGRTGVTL